ncbi:MAG: hypothetical protein HOV96_19385 [Nonomuraea sp.]|nr:hypothetical protein [Nonomuraea sp.]
MEHRFYFSRKAREDYDLEDAICSGCGHPDPGGLHWWEIAGLPHCDNCTILAMEVAEAAGEPLFYGQVLTLAQREELDQRDRQNISSN